MDAKLAADKKQRNEQSPIEKGLQKMDEKTLQNMDKLFQTAFYLAWKERPFTDFPDLLDLQTLRLRYNYLNIRLLLVHNLDFSLIGQETKGYLELSHDWLPV